MTDLLGTCLAWADGLVAVRTAAGETVEIPVGDIVSGKPVPPRPSVRHRVSAAEAEAHTADLAEELETASVGAWTLRSEPRPAGRLRRRVNSALALTDPGGSVVEAAAAVQAFYAARGRPARIQVERDGAVELALRDLGWRVDPSGDADFLLASAAQVRRRLPRALPPADLVTGERQGRAAIRAGDAVIAQGAAVLTGSGGDWIGLHALEVDPEHRRRGWATAVVAALLEWGAERGATTAWLHVETANSAALALYGGLGFGVHHGVRYLEAPDAGPADAATR